MKLKVLLVSISCMGSLLHAAGGGSSGAVAESAARKLSAEEQERANKELDEAVNNEDIQAVRAALAAGANINKQSSFGFPPLFKAIMGIDKNSSGKEKEIVELLIDSGADVNVINILSDTPLSLLLSQTKKDQGSYKSIILKLLAKGAQVRPADFALVASPEIVRTLLGTGVRPDAQAFFGIIMNWSEYKRWYQIDVLVPLLESVSPSELNAMRQNEGDTLLHGAMLMLTLGCVPPATIQLLLDYGLDPLQSNDAGKNTYQLANETGNLEVIAILENYRKNLEQYREQFKATTKAETTKQFGGAAGPAGIIAEYARPSTLPRAPRAPAAGAHAPGGVAAGAAAAPVSGSEMADVD